jgi:hypothetical protein
VCARASWSRGAPDREVADVAQGCLQAIDAITGVHANAVGRRAPESAGNLAGLDLCGFAEICEPSLPFLQYWRVRMTLTTDPATAALIISFNQPNSPGIYYMAA